jgi:hypothetical protein
MIARYRILQAGAEQHASRDPGIVQPDRETAPLQRALKPYGDGVVGRDGKRSMVAGSPQATRLAGSIPRLAASP